MSKESIKLKKKERKFKRHNVYILALGLSELANPIRTLFKKRGKKWTSLK